ncbi:RrF2 family transcriptional regulator [Methylophaga thiooxydans]|uniref:RrF2 family transcriptional regulator n=1 Tax=Methylophaga thiooxydans TaxID=392484 RepID=UPI000560435A|nr:Rrf2 family transcriptional regulator [Methylophaga thiooxydans]
MQINRYTDYAYRVLMYLAVNKDERVTRKQIAKYYSISPEHLRKIIHKLSQLGYIKTYLGRGGGIVINKPLNSINIGTIFIEFEGISPLINCVETLCPLRASCNLSDLFSDAQNIFVEELKKKTMDELINNPYMKKSLLSGNPVRL